MEKKDPEENMIYTIQVGFGKSSRKFKVYAGKEYIISPINPRNMKNRGRHVIVLEKILRNPSNENGDYVAKVRYENNRVGRVDFSVLLPVDQADILPIE